MNQRRILEQISDERVRQDLKWGGPEHDDHHEWKDWSTLVDERTTNPTRENLVQAAALLVAWIEADDRNLLRHVTDPNG